MTRGRALITVLAVVLALCAAGCGVTATHHASGSENETLRTASGQAATVCSHAHPGTQYAVAVFAPFAASSLKASDVTPNPWSQLPANTVVFSCFSGVRGAMQGVFVDAAGLSTPIPAQTLAACTPLSVPAGVPVPPGSQVSCTIHHGTSSGSINPAIAAVIAVLVLGVVGWIYLRRRKRMSAPL